MANLKDIAKLKGIDIGEKPQTVAPSQFQRRRSWTQPEEEIKPLVNNNLIIKEPLEKHTATITKTVENDLNSIPQSAPKDIPTQRPAIVKQVEKPLANNDLIIRQPLDINHLVGKEKTLLCYVVSLCKNRGSLETDTVLSDDLKNVLGVDNNGLANMIFRVKDKGFLNLIEQKKGRVSWRKFSVPKEIYEQIIKKGLDNHTSIIREQSPKPLEKPLDNHTYSNNSSLNNKNNYNHIEIPENLTEIGFGGRHISQILEIGKLNETELQESLHHFSQDLKTGLKARVKTSPLGLLIGILRNGSPYISEEYLSSLKADLDRVKSRVQQYEAIQSELQENAVKARFIDWRDKNPDRVEQIKNEVAGENSFMAGNPKFLEMLIFQKWEEENNRPPEATV